MINLLYIFLFILVFIIIILIYSNCKKYLFILFNITNNISQESKLDNHYKNNHYKNNDSLVYNDIPDFYTIDGPIYPIKNKNSNYNEYTRPISILTSNTTENLIQIGTLTNNNNDIYPLFGKINEKYNKRWNYFTTNSYNVFIPLNYNNKNCNKDIGCDQLFTGDYIYIPQFRDRFRVDII